MKDSLSDFPQLTHGSLTYLDSAASSLTPEQVLDAMDLYYRSYRANIHRGLYQSAECASKEYEKARERVASFVGADADEIIFSASATCASNMLVYALEQSIELSKGDEILVSAAEHHAALVPLQQLAKRHGMVIKTIPITDDYQLDMNTFHQYLNERTRIVSTMYASNVLGSVFDVAQVAQAAKKYNVITICDATAVVGHAPMNMRDLGIDFAYFSGHKMCGPTGIGVLYGRRESLIDLNPSFFGGSMIETVTCADATFTSGIERFEAGTPAIAEAIGLGAAVDYLEEKELETVEKHISELCDYALQALDKIDGVRILSIRDPQKNIGIISFTVNSIHPHDVAQVLADDGVAIRAGHHCAMPLMHALKVPATARMSFYLYNTQDDIDRCVESIRHAQRIFG